MKRLILIALLGLSLTGCGELFSDPNLNDRLAKENEQCLARKMAPEFEEGSFFGRQPRIVCKPAKLSMLQELEFMTWVARRERAQTKKPILLPEELIHDRIDR